MEEFVEEGDRGRSFVGGDGIEAIITGMGAGVSEQADLVRPFHKMGMEGLRLAELLYLIPERLASGSVVVDTERPFEPLQRPPCKGRPPTPCGLPSSRR
ncbi:MAG: hypothetical protein M3075_13685 [Candidatus Dormibacteraeota bacterium]|nr:hypothetical protein [Candidatus Dormibacteraeota bacterium]MDQ6920152.1 hypothetical protein [Candidatus Dormibacteraeota bacterium]